MKRVMVSGCFDLLHSGHIAFFEAAAAYGDLTVALGSDQTVFELKGRAPVMSETERLYMVQSVGVVKDAFVSSGSGLLDFAPELQTLRPDRFVVNEDGNMPQKRHLCEELGIEYVVLKREPHAGLPTRSTTNLRQIDQMPYRLDLAGGWLDQPFVSQHHPGPVITVSLEPTLSFNERSGMASSTRRTAQDLWGARLPAGDPAKLAHTLFCCDNPPGTQEISGSQDAIGIVIPGLNKAHYEGQYWPSEIVTVQDEAVLDFVETAVYLVALGPRESGYAVLSDTDISAAGAQRLATAAEQCWHALLEQDIVAFGRFMRESLDAQVAMLPYMMNPLIAELIEQYRDQALGWKLSGAGGGGYLVLVADTPIEGAIQLTVRRAA